MSSTDRLIADMVEDLGPVRPLPRLRSAFAVVLAVWAAVLGAVLISQEYDAGARSLLDNRVYLASFLGLIVAAIGSTVSALAAGVPGRDREENLGLGLSVFGLLAAAVACLFGMSQLGFPAELFAPATDGMCFRNGLYLSVLPAGVILSFLVRGWAARPVRASLVGLVAAGVLGASVVHLSCDYLDPRHLLMGHLTVPLVLAGLGLYPLALLLRRMRG